MSRESHMNRAKVKIVQISPNFFSVRRRLFGFLWWEPILTDNGTLHASTLKDAELLAEDEAQR